MTTSESVRALVFVGLALIGCLIRTYIRTANGEKEDEVHFWSSNFSQQQLQYQQHNQQPHSQSAEPKRRDRAATITQDTSHILHPRSATSSGEVSQAVSVLHDQPPVFPDFDTGSPRDRPTFARPASTAAIDLNGEDIGEAYEDWAAMRHARGDCSEDAESSIDKLIQQRTFKKQLVNMPHLDSLGISGASTPTVWTAHFPAAQLRPY
ncbi:hypothetical protein BCV70DRAFT_6958 [Testicularia cyperi]|uniref:Uncharacterized protein n=1 Tax=Testicularia cyperi TaxID=1882483 RepID=A0A317XZX6_9BASI|nr:hypothetical protein BCV70DRAFT_6958 [Testicularia cyperi]